MRNNYDMDDIIYRNFMMPAVMPKDNLNNKKYIG